MRLSQHFTLDELTVSETAARRGIDNTPPEAVLANLRETARCMEEVRAILGAKPILVTSGYRSPALNAAIGAKDSSAHVLGWAVDFTCPGYGTPLEVARRIAEWAPQINLKYDQLIHEFRRWVHVSFNPQARSMLLTIDDRGTRRGLE